MAKVYQNIPREKIPWWPVINYDTCAGCQECYEFCPNDVFDWDDNDGQHPVVARPTNCVVFCKSCARICSMEAIQFPEKEEIVALIRELRQLYKDE